jgi:hypothetical protein
MDTVKVSYMLSILFLYTYINVSQIVQCYSYVRDSILLYW